MLSQKVLRQFNTEIKKVGELLGERAALPARLRK